MPNFMIGAPRITSGEVAAASCRSSVREVSEVILNTNPSDPHILKGTSEFRLKYLLSVHQGSVLSYESRMCSKPFVSF